MYGCEGTKGGRLKERIFPRLLGDATPHFSPASCSYRVLRSKDNTGRVVVWKQLNAPPSFTLEASFCGPDYGALQGAHFNTAHLQQMGAAFVPALLDLSDPLQAPNPNPNPNLGAAHAVQRDVGPRVPELRA